jgi:enoyl-CoA hydratase
MGDTVTFEKKNDIGILKINRPKALNAISVQVIRDLDEHLDKIDADRNLRGLIVTGSGDKAFVAGADISEMAKMNTDQAREFAKRGQAVLRRLEIIKIPVIAAVNGFALGGGTELACACDFIYASENAVFGQPEVMLGLMPGFGGTQRLSRFIGLGKARELIYTGEQIDVQKAYEWGLVNKICKSDELLSEALKTLEVIATRAPLAVASSKEAINDGYDVPIDKGMSFELDLFSDLFETDDVKEGTQAFLEKRAPKFSGE